MAGQLRPLDPPIRRRDFARGARRVVVLGCFRCPQFLTPPPVVGFPIVVSAPQCPDPTEEERKEMYACCTKAVSVLTYVETELLPHIGEPCYDLCDDTITAWRLLAFSQAQARRFVGGGRRRLPCCACAIGDAGCDGVIVAAF